tara:strand:+ start:136588 stop:137229 length:642 start_codon:yes stop_codon:yes gene_type:complete
VTIYKNSHGTISLGLTGSLAMGKSTVAGMFEDMGVPVHDSDKVVHDLLQNDKSVNAAIQKEFPNCISENGAIDRQALGKIVFNGPMDKKKLEAILHPLVHIAQDRFFQLHKDKGTKIIMFDIPLLFETGRDNDFDHVVTVSCPKFIQRRRALKRPFMTAQKFEAILSAQMPDGEKRKKSDFIVHTGWGHAFAKWQVTSILKKIKKTEKFITDA